MSLRKSGVPCGLLGTQRALIVCMALLLASCGWLTAYRIDIQQGNVVDATQVAQLRVGLSKDQVRFVLGTPLLIDVFHPERWDYIYVLDRRNKGEVTRNRVTAFFSKDGNLERWFADVPPASTDAPVGRVIDLGPAKTESAPPPAASNKVD